MTLLMTFVENPEIDSKYATTNGPAAHHEEDRIRGGFPRSFLVRGEAASIQWREGFATMFLERDIPQLGIRIPSTALRRFWVMLAHYHGQTWNASELARTMDVS